MFMYFLSPHGMPATWRSRAQTGIRAELPSGKLPATRIRRRISPLQPLNHIVSANTDTVFAGKVAVRQRFLFAASYRLLALSLGLLGPKPIDSKKNRFFNSRILADPKSTDFESSLSKKSGRPPGVRQSAICRLAAQRRVTRSCTPTSGTPDRPPQTGRHRDGPLPPPGWS